MHDGICRSEDTPEYRERRRRAFEGLTFSESAESIGALMREQGLADWEIEAATAMVSSPDFMRSINEPNDVNRSVIITSLGRRHGIPPDIAYGLYVDMMVGSGIEDECWEFECFVDLNDVDDDVRESLRRAEDGDAEAQYEMGLRYRRGDGVFEDDYESARWLLQAAEQGHADAMYEVGIAYDSGIGLPMDADIADEWFRKAADAGCKRAKELFG